MRDSYEHEECEQERGFRRQTFAKYGPSDGFVGLYAGRVKQRPGSHRAGICGSRKTPDTGEQQRYQRADHNKWREQKG